MRRIILRVASLALLCGTLLCTASCAVPRAEGEKIQVLCTLFSEYDWARNVVGANENIELDLLVGDGADIHSYQPTAADIIKITECDLLLYTGGGAGSWIEDALELASNKNVKVVDLSESKGVTLHEISSSSEGGSHSHTHEGHEEHDHGGFDEHVWLSLANARAMVERISDELCLLDEGGAESYRANAKAYAEKLEWLDIGFEQALERIPEKDRFVLFADRFPFVYLLRDYGIGYRAPFEGCSTDAYADFEVVVSLIEAASEHAVGYILLCEDGDESLARTIIGSIKGGEIDIVRLNSLQRVSRGDVMNESCSYLSQMQKNIEVLTSVLTGQN